MNETSIHAVVAGSPAGEARYPRSARVVRGICERATVAPEMASHLHTSVNVG
jgi:hypothetical protein